jgi:hypothetical protein
MFNSPLVLGVNELNTWDDFPSILKSLNSLGNNTGNILFPHGIMSALVGVTRSDFSLSDSLVADRDIIIVAAANWINDFEDYGWLADRLEQLSLPALIVGIGAQPSTTENWVQNISPGTLKLLNYCAKTTNSISVRGQFTKDVLAKIGFQNVEITGCPSLLSYSTLESKPVIPQPNEKKMIIHSTRHGFQSHISSAQQWLYREAYKNNLGLLLQSEVPDIYISLARTSRTDPMQQIKDVVCQVYGSQDYNSIFNYLNSRSVVFGSMPIWLKGISSYTFSVGTRIHGTISSLLSGVPSLLLTHDKRTEELAKSLSIPSLPIENLNLDAPFDSSFFFQAYSQCPAPFSTYGSYYKKFSQFFDSNNLKIKAA